MSVPMPEVEWSLISERVTAGMSAAKSRGKQLWRPKTPRRVCNEIERLAASTPLSVRQIHETIEGKARRSIVGAIVKRVRATPAIAP